MTKIDYLRDEFERIGCKPPKNPFDPRLYVGWHYTEILVSGIEEKLFDYDILCSVLAKIPDYAGEGCFWDKVRTTDFQKLCDRLNRGLLLSVVR